MITSILHVELMMHSATSTWHGVTQLIMFSVQYTVQSYSSVTVPVTVPVPVTVTVPVPIPNDQIKNIQLLEKHVGDCFFATNFAIGDAVLVKEGPLTGLRGIIDKMDKKKLHIHVDTIPGSVSIEVKPNQVQYDKDSLYKLVTEKRIFE